MTHSLDQLEQRMHAVDRYVQGEMSAAEVQSFEAMMAGDASLAADVAAQRTLSAALKVSFSPSPPPALPAIPRSVPEGGSGGWRIAPPLWLGAGVLAVVAAASVWVAVSLPTAKPTFTSDPSSVYEHAFDAKHPFSPHDKTDLEVAISTKVGHNVQLSDDNDVTYGEMTGAVGGTPMALGIDVRAGTDRVLLIIDLAPTSEKPSDHVTTTSLDHGLYSHSLIRDGLRLMEISPRAKPALVTRIHVGS